MAFTNLLCQDCNNIIPNLVRKVNGKIEIFGFGTALDTGLTGFTGVGCLSERAALAVRSYLTQRRRERREILAV